MSLSVQGIILVTPILKDFCCHSMSGFTGGNIFYFQYRVNENSWIYMM